MTAPANQTISLNDIGLRYLTGLQHLSDLMVLTWAGVRNVSEESYEETFRSIAGLPSTQARFSMDLARTEAARWWFKSSLGEILGLCGVFLEDIRKVSGVVVFNIAKTTGSADLAALAAEINSNSGPLDVPTRLKNLKDRYGLVIPMESEILSLVATHRCFLQAGGVIPNGATLTLHLKAVQPVAGDKNNLNLTDYKHTWKAGERITISREEHAAVFTTISVFLTAMLTSVQDFAKVSGLVESPSPQ